MARRKAPGRGGAPATPAKSKRKTSGGEAETSIQVAAPSEVVTQEQIQEAIDRVIAKAEADEKAKTTKTGTGLSLSKEIAACAKITGFEKDDIRWAVSQRLRSPEEIDAETRRRTRIAGYFKMKIGGQLGLLDDGTSLADQSERDAKKDGDPQVLAAAEAQGHQAGSDGAGMSTNPYPEGSKRHERWNTGWNLAQAAIAERMGERKPTHAAAHA